MNEEGDDIVINSIEEKMSRESMCGKVNVESTAEHIEIMADELRARAAELRGVAIRMRETNDLSYAAEALNIIVNSTSALRLDLLVTRPLREFGVK